MKTNLMVMRFVCAAAPLMVGHAPFKCRVQPFVISPVFAGVVYDK
jgi:hypothetical protein